MAAASNNTHPSYGEAALLVAISFGWFIFASVLAVVKGFPSSTSSFSDSALLSLMGVELVFGTLALAFLHRCGYALRDLLPAPSWRGCLEGVLLCMAAALVCNVVWMLVPNSYRHDAVQPIAQMLANGKPTLVVAFAVAVLNGLYEETFLLGYLTRGFAALGASFAVGLGVLVRLLYHLYQGPNGALSIVVYGIVLGAVYWRTGRLWPAVFAHSLTDVLALS